MSRIISVHSYKGGCGKTLVAINLAYKLSQNYRVLLIEADFLMPCFFQIFPSTSIRKYYNDFYSDSQVPLRECIVQGSFDNLDIIYSSPEYNPVDKIYTMDQKWHLNRLKALMKQIGEITPQYDYILMDTPSGRNFVAISNLILSHLVIVVIRPTDYSALGTKLMLEEVYQKTKPETLLPCFLIFNQVPSPESREMEDKLKTWITQFNVNQSIKKTINIPLFMKTALNVALGKVILLEDDPFSKYLDSICADILNLFEEDH
ncbi:MAG: ParA family protein [Candidatus Odinarchaeota archaeon]